MRFAATSKLRTAAIAATVAMFVVGGVAGCATEVSGHAAPGMTAVDPKGLTIGPYPSAPRDYTVDGFEKDDVFRIESRRMLGYLVLPYDVDSDIGHLVDTRLVEATSSIFDDGLVGVLPGQYLPVVERNNFIAGVYTQRSNDSLRSIKNLAIALLRFPSDAAARTAAAEFDRATDEFKPGRHPVAIDGYPDIRASSDNDKKGYVFLARGPFVLLSMITMPESDSKALGTQFKKMLDLQIPKLDSLVPTPVDDILDLPLNPDGIMRRTLPPTKETREYSRDNYVGIYDGIGQLHFERDGPDLKRTLQEAGTDLVAQHQSIIYRTRDLAASFRLQNALAHLGTDDEAIDSPPGLPDARCLKLDESEPIFNSKYLCILVYDRYVAVLGSQGQGLGIFDPVLYQATAAQYSILAKTQ
ncbi:DUF7373 family lipoprotein [Nocardia sp. CA-129566]|uniref:DUF7373 family lipoprotein n=1 Tax=Nocardia sp. CA-129566 TaxID=3239976 RepID=UPI003D972B01